MATEVLKAPFPWFGGKSRVAHLVWPRLGKVQNYVEPFAGSLAVLLMRPEELMGSYDTVNDRDCYLTNFWRAVADCPDGVADLADWPVNENDLHARHAWLVNEGRELVCRERMEGSPTYYNLQVAGWWVWGICAWIGSGWCSGEGPWIVEDGRLVRKPGHDVVGQKRERPHLGRSQGVHRQLPHLGNNGQGVHQPTRSDSLREWMQAISDRLRRVRVCCGDWARVVTDGALANGEPKGIFLDPPYDQDIRCKGCYNEDTVGLSAQVREWAIAHGDRKNYRIALCGYEGEHDMPSDWECLIWKAGSSMKTSRCKAEGRTMDNARKERIWFSPYCLRPDSTQPPKPQLLLGDDED